MERMNYKSLLEASQAKALEVVGYFASEADASQVAQTAEWQSRGAWVVSLANSPGDDYAVVVRN